MPQGIEPSNLDKVFWPELGLTKGDLLAYFDAVAPYLIPAIADRPLTLKRYPDGIHGFSFFQKNAPKYTPDWVETITLPAWSAKRDVSYVLCNSKRTLMWLANQAAIELHPWLSRRDRIERPDHLVLDLDPPEGGLQLAVEVAFLLREVLDDAGLQAAAKTSGSKGVHVYVPLRRSHDYGQVRFAADTIAHRVEQLAPDRTTTDVKLSERHGRVYLDTGRVAPGAHIAAPYSPRARETAAVSFPVTWDELRTVDPAAFTIRTAPDILRAEGDRWKELMPPRQALPANLLP